MSAEKKYLQASIDALRKWQRHSLLREYGEDGIVLSGNLVLSDHLNNVLKVAENVVLEAD